MTTKMFAKEVGIEKVREYFESHITKGLVRFAFIKKDGSTREMLATKKMSMVPDEHQPTGNKPVWTKPNMMRVFDVVTDGWRIVTLDNLLWVEVED